MRRTTSLDRELLECQTTAGNLIKQLFREEGIPKEQVTEYTRGSLFVEVPLGVFAGVVSGSGPTEEPPVNHATDAHEGGM